ncbi:hypothetical protein [Jannaschia sp. 2305UL9-9]|uniref:hypothetical protein n=1 Tax=Jannaschia sp. 2305UL9-9 TaxID=3121638 RepID=UPI003527E71A
MIASLAWYPGARPAWERLWTSIRAHLPTRSPEHLVWPEDFATHWRDQGLLLSMTCALPLQQGLADHVHVVGSPDWDLPDMPPGHYASHVVMRADDPRTPAQAATDGLAVNNPDSQSGFGTLVAAGLAGRVILTGSHAASARAVADGRAALAAIDVVTWTHLAAPDLAIRETTRPTPSTPFITAQADLIHPLRHAIRAAIAAQSPADRAATRLVGLTMLPPAAYATTAAAPHCNSARIPA